MPTAIRSAVRVLVLADRLPQDGDREAVRAVIEAAGGAHVRLVAPAAALPGERWIADRTARRRAARERLDAWSVLLSERARTIEREIGDEGPQSAVADALADFRAEAVLHVPAATTDRAAARSHDSVLARLRAWASGILAAPAVRPG